MVNTIYFIFIIMNSSIKMMDYFLIAGIDDNMEIEDPAMNRLVKSNLFNRQSLP